MKTDALIELLARGAGPAPRGVVGRRLAWAAALGLVCSAALALGLWGTLPSATYATAVPWVKLACAAVLAGTGGWLTSQLARPASRWGWPCIAVAVVWASVLGGASLIGPMPSLQDEASAGHRGYGCPWNVLALSLPALACLLWAVRGLAPTRARAAGAAAGLTAGALGALGYSLTCPEVSPVFAAAGYTLGIGAAALLGCLLGPRTLRW